MNENFKDNKIVETIEIDERITTIDDEGNIYWVNKNQNEEKPKKKFLGVGGVLGAILEWVVLIGVAVLIALIIRDNVFMMVHVQGPSMQNTLQDRDWLYVHRFLYNPDSADNRGDIVIFRPEQDPDKVYIKRVIAVAGDTIYISSEGDVYVNNEIVDEPYIKEPNFRIGLRALGDFSRENPKIIEEGYIFTMGDNRNQSQDSRHIGPIPVERIKGRAIFRVFPFSEFGGLN